MKTIIINAGPRKNWNTDLMLKEAQKGAGSAGAETEYIDLYDLDFKGCRSCLACKIKGAERNKCYWKDDLSPVIEKILSADAVIFGCTKLATVDLDSCTYVGDEAFMNSGIRKKIIASIMI